MALTVHVWSDVVCPWCYIGKRRFEEAVQKFGEPVEIEWHSFELNQARPAPETKKLGYVEWLGKKFGDVQRAGAMIDQVSSVAAKEGLQFKLRDAVPAHTFDAHRLLQFAASEGKGGELHEKLFAAHFTRSVDLNDHAALASLAGGVGLDVDRAAAVLASDDFSAEVRADEADARSLGISGVPFFVIGRYGVSGAQSADTFLGALDRAFTEGSIPASEDAEGAACTPETC